MDIQNSVEQELSQLGHDQKEQILENFSHFKQFLSNKVEFGEKMGLSEESLAKATEYVANYLANHEEPQNREEQVLMELWRSGDKDQQHALAHMLLNMVQK